MPISISSLPSTSTNVSPSAVKRWSDQQTTNVALEASSASISLDRQLEIVRCAPAAIVSRLASNIHAAPEALRLIFATRRTHESLKRLASNTATPLDVIQEITSVQVAIGVFSNVVVHRAQQNLASRSVPVAKPKKARTPR